MYILETKYLKNESKFQALAIGEKDQEYRSYRAGKCYR